MPVALKTTTKKKYVARAVNSDYEEPRLPLCNGDTERTIGIWDAHLHLLVLPCPVSTANRQLQQPILKRARKLRVQTPQG